VRISNSTLNVRNRSTAAPGAAASSPRKSGSHVAMSGKSGSSKRTLESTRRSSVRPAARLSSSPEAVSPRKRLRRGANVRQFIDDAAADGPASDEGSGGSLKDFVEDDGDVVVQDRYLLSFLIKRLIFRVKVTIIRSSRKR
jgi:hypothetical protein